MVKRYVEESEELEPARKKLSTNSRGIGPGDILVDISGKEWKLGKAVGQGAFGEIYMASDDISKEVNESSPFVAKLELHSNGPLFVEVNFYLRVAKIKQINEWKLKKRKAIGIPHYIASGSHVKDHTKYRFLILPRYSVDLQQVLERHNNKFNIKTVLTIGLQLLDILEYIHSHGFIHADVKASNILLHDDKMKAPRLAPPPEIDRTVLMHRLPQISRIRAARLKDSKVVLRRNLRPNKNLHLPYYRKCDCYGPHSPHSPEQTRPTNNANNKVDLNQIYLLDYGLASKYLLSNGEHKAYCYDERKAHAGTVIFCSLDAHDGVQSRRSDLESLGYNMVYWLTASLPWIINAEDYEIVKKKKRLCLQELDNFLHFSFGKNTPIFLRNYFVYVKSLTYDQTPDYEYCRKVLMQGFTEYGYKKVFTLDFANKEGWGCKQKRMKNAENDRRRMSVVSIIRTPLKSNLPAKHVLRKNKAAKSRLLRWSKILIDPELIIKSGKKIREKEQEFDTSDSLENLNILDLNPTNAMLNVYNNYLERQNNIEIGVSPKHRVDYSLQQIEGYNATMMAIHQKMLENRETELAAKALHTRTLKRKPKAKRKTTKVQNASKKEEVQQSASTQTTSKYYNTRTRTRRL